MLKEHLEEVTHQKARRVFADKVGYYISFFKLGFHWELTRSKIK